MAVDVVEGEEEEKIDLQQMADEVLAGQVFELPKEKKRISRQNNSSYSNEAGNGKDRVKTKSGNRKEEQGEQQEEVKKKIIYLQKYYSAREGILAEAVLIGGKPCFLVSRKEKPSFIEIQSSLELTDEILKPCESSSYINLPYGFDSEVVLRECIQRAKEQTLDTLQKKQDNMA
jgi:hypothetical protein